MGECGVTRNIDCQLMSGIDNKEDYTKIEGLQILHSAGGGSSAGISSILFAGVTVKDSIVRKSSVVAGEGVKIIGTNIANAFVVNTVVSGGWDYGIDIATNGGYGYAYNTTSYGNNYGYNGFHTQNLKNCIGAGNTIADFARVSSYPVNITNCASSDATAGTFSGTGTRVNQTFSFIDPVNGNFHLSSSDTGAKNYGTDLSTDFNLSFSTDIDGETRTGYWDIGADETSGGGAPVADTTAPSIPTNLLATVVSPSQVNLTWSASTDNTGVTGYRIYRNGTQITTTTGTTYSNTGLSASTLYTYTVSAYDLAGNVSPQSTGASATTQNLSADTTAPSIPTNLLATVVSPSQVNLSWSASTDSTGVTGYRIYRDGTQITTTTGITYSNTGLSASTLYTYTVSAYDAATNASAQSTGASATTQTATTVTTTGAPVLNFSDIISGPKTGNTDGLGSGAIVSIWGNSLGSSQGTSQVYVGGVPASHIYYWGNADGNPNAGPADLYTYHKMQTISFAIPANAPDGLTNISVMVNGVQSNTLPFTVRAGNIYFIKTGGNNTGAGTWQTPWGTFMENGNSRMTNGDILYVVGAFNSTGGVNGLLIRYNDFQNTAERPTAVIGYPGSTAYLNGSSNGIGVWGSPPYPQYWVFSKLKVETMETGISSIKGMRAIANEITGPLASGQSGAISGSKDGTSGVKSFGNYIHDFGLNSYDIRLHHVFYLSNRDGTPNEAYELGWNYLLNNHARGGLHNYDEGICGDFTGIIKVHNNVVVNQAGTSFDVGGSGGGYDGTGCLKVPFEVYNNLFIKSGQTPFNDPAISVTYSGTKSHIKFYNNTIYGWGSSEAVYIQDNGSATWNFGGTFEWINNIVVDTDNLPYSHSVYYKTPSVSSNNIWYNGGDGNPSSVPAWDPTASSANPLFVNPSVGDFTLQSISSAINAGSSLVSSLVTRDYFGISRPQGSAYDIGAFEYCTNCTTTTTTTQPTGDTTAPSIPTNLLATVVSPSQINLSWSASTDNTAVTGYRIYRNGTQITTTTGTTYSNTGLSASTLYTYTVSAYDLAGNVSSQSTGASATTQNQPVADTTAPTITSIASSVTTTGATISWTTNEAGTSRVEYGLTTSYGNTTSLSTSLTSHSHTLSSLPPNTTYHYRVNTTDSAGNTATSQDRTFTTSAVSDTTAPSSITDLTTSSLGQTSLTLSWTVPTDTSGIASYDIRYSTTPITSTTFSSATQLTNVPLPTTSGSTQTQYVSVGLTPNTTYSFAIKSTDAVGNVSSLSNIATGTTLSAPTTTSTTASTQTGTVSVPTVSSGGGGGGGYTIYQLSDVTPPKNPTNVRIEPTNTQATLSWTNPTDPDFVRVKIVRKTGSAVSSHTDGTTVYDGTATTFTDTNLANNQTYYYAIYAYDKVPNYTSFIGLSATPQASLTQTNVSYTTIEAGCTETTTYSTTTGVPCTKVPTAFRPFYTFSKDRAVTYGMKDSTDVRELQKILQFEGLLSLASSADGAFGPGTKSAIIAFQKKYSITPAQGTVGPLTKTKLNQLYGSTTISTTFYRNLTIGSKGEDVKKLQQLLNTDIATRISATGAGSPGNETTYFGAATRAAVIKYQKKYNISPASGYVGPLTRGKLEGR